MKATRKPGNVINRVHGFPRDREGKEFVRFAEWHYSRFHDPIICRREARKLIAAYRSYLKMGISNLNTETKSNDTNSSTARS